MNLAQPKLRQEMLYFARSILPNEEDAEDVVQEVLARCLQTPDLEITKAYLFKSVKNRSLNRFRNHGRFEKLKKGIRQFYRAHGNENPKKVQSSIEEYLTELPLQFREILLLRIKYELSHKEISEILDIPEGTAKSRIHYGLEKLREKYKN